MIIKKMPDESWVRSHEACKAYGVSQRTACHWRDHGHVRYRRDSVRVEVHLGDFRRMTFGLRAKREIKGQEDAVVLKFEDRLRPAECAHIDCGAPRDPDSWLFMCQGHQFLADKLVSA